MRELARLRGALRLATICCLTLILIHAVEAEQQQPTESKITAKNFEKIKEGEGKLTEADVSAILGAPSRLTILPGGNVEMAWRDSIEVRVAIKNGKATEIKAMYSGSHPGAGEYAARLRKLKVGMTAREVRDVLGPPDGVARFPDPKQPDRPATWKRVNRITVEFSEGKIKKRPSFELNVAK